MTLNCITALIVFVAAAQAQYHAGYGYPGYGRNLGYAGGYAGYAGGYAGYPYGGHPNLGYVPGYVRGGVAVGRGQVGIAHPTLPLAARREDAEYDPNPQYTFSYQVEDAVTGDSKAQTESRQGDVVQGSYTLIEPDGSRRTVDYTADPVSGFNAVVRKDGEIASAPVASPVGSAPVALRGGPIVGGIGYRGAPIPAVNRAGPVYVGGHTLQSPYGHYGY